jgi:hypothetical protein
MIAFPLSAITHGSLRVLYVGTNVKLCKELGQIDLRGRIETAEGKTVFILRR